MHINRISKSIGRIIFLVCLITLSGTITSHSLELTRSFDFHDKNMFGGRIGSYINSSDEKPSDDLDYAVDFKSSSAYIEFFYAHRLNKAIALEISFGLFKRGDIRYDLNSGLIDRAVMIYPFWLSARVYPFFKIKSRLHFFVQPGMGLVYGRRDIVNTNYIDLSTNDYLTNTESRSEFTYLLGGGADYQLFRKMAITISLKYMPADFGKALAEVHDYSGWTLTFGAAYLWSK